MESPVAAEAAFVRFQDVDLEYDETSGKVIEGISLAIREREFVAIVGPSGCGKSSFMRLCSGLRSPTRGTIHVAGSQVCAPLKMVGMAFQNSTLLPWRTALDNVLLPLQIVEPYRSSFARKRASYEARARELLGSVGLAGFEDKFPWQLSGGMQQRTSICRALIHEPKLLLLDEPFAALDAFTREELWCVLRDLWNHNPVTVILVTHDLREAAFLADTVYVMSKRPGTIAARFDIDFPHPRSLEVTYTDRFAKTVLALREQVGGMRPQ
jgi:NitT/TauT family transport system ATP-binding protein